MKILKKRLIALLLGICMVVAMMPMTALVSFAEISGDFEYEILSEKDKTCQITVYNGSASELIIPEEIDGYSVIKIEDFAFSQCATLVSAIIPNGVTEIGYSSFDSCTSLESIVIPNSVTSIDEHAFNRCTSLENIVIPESVTSIGDFAFYRCTSLANITIPKSVTSIGSRAFGSTAVCADLSNWENGVFYIGDCLLDTDREITDEVIIKPGTRLIANGAFEWTSVTSVVIPNSVEIIGFGAFSDCTSLTEITIPDSVTSIGDSAFSFCSNLVSVTLPKDITSISDGAFFACLSLVNITIPDSVTSIGSGAFTGCASLTDIELPDSVTSIGDGAFSQCTSLRSITIPSSVTSIDRGAFEKCSALSVITVENDNDYFCTVDGVLFSKDKSVLLQYPAGKKNTDYIVPQSVLEIAPSSFYGAPLASVTIPDSVMCIGATAFWDTDLYNNENNWENGVLYISNHLIECKEDFVGEYVVKPGTKTIADFSFAFAGDLTGIALPDSLKTIGKNAFLYCDSLLNVSIPDSVVSIGEAAFYDCSLTSISIPASVTNIGDHALGYCLETAFDEKVEGFTIFGIPGSEAERYALDNEFEFISNIIELEDKATGVRIAAKRDIIPEGAELKVVNTETTYDISLIKDGSQIQPDGEVTVRIPVPDAMKSAKCSISRKEADGTFTDMNAVYADGYMLFADDSLGVYVLSAEFENTANPEIPNTDGKAMMNISTLTLLSGLCCVTLLSKKRKK